ncbi:MAG TPA: inosine/xanthosine triphosphatase [Acidilobales archaeon]|nr:MAG: serine phosphatase [Desulfurococcales archaeon ex4484_42]HDD25588.1 inosine/xanthosine triphosphatase [Acidilobales archaeon]
MITVALGSTNKAKIAGVEKAFKKFFPNVRVTPVKVESGVPNQPLSLEETYKGAYNRVMNLCKRVKADFYVGVEAGIFGFNGRFLDVQVVVVFDGEKWGVGFSPAFEVPEKFLRDLRGGEELESVVDRHYGTKDVGEDIGFIGLLTREVVTRIDLTYMATVMALVPFINKDLYLT